MNPRTQNIDFLENSFDNFNYILVIYEDHLPK